MAHIKRILRVGGASLVLALCAAPARAEPWEGFSAKEPGLLRDRGRRAGGQPRSLQPADVHVLRQRMRGEDDLTHPGDEGLDGGAKLRGGWRRKRPHRT